MNLLHLEQKFAKVKLLGNLGYTVVSLHRVQFPNALMFVIARPLNFLSDKKLIIEQIQFFKTLKPFCADFKLQSDLIRSSNKGKLQVFKETLELDKVQFPWHYEKYFKWINPISTSEQNPDPNNIEFYITTEQLKRDPKYYSYNQIAHIGYNNYISFEELREALSIIWAKQLNIPMSQIFINDIPSDGLTDRIFRWSYMHLKNFNQIPKDFWYKPLL